MKTIYNCICNACTLCMRVNIKHCETKACSLMQGEGQVHSVWREEARASRELTSPDASASC